MPEPIEQHVLKRYLFGELPETERERVSERLFSDDAVFDSLREMEDDLVDALAHGELSAAEAEKVRRFLDETGQADRPRIARLIVPKPRRSMAWIRHLGIGFAACVLIVLAWTQRHQDAPKNRDAQPVNVAPKVFAFQLPPGTLRGENQLRHVKIPEDSGFVDVGLELEPGYTSYQVILKANSGEETARAATAQAGRFVLRVPAAALKPGRYEIVVLGQRPGRSAEPLNYYYYAVD